ncbi:hypothetical protein [Romboutsia sp. Marseille-P6047]|uniref:hypothetical protein n=1 Tax=Romboutsia sp. Marseille-P6047 TaxID=2161817 RepID=UPI001FA9BFBA|nr:hypothetical protein [Romboutsia sp. Marseille-P6047]
MSDNDGKKDSHIGIGKGILPEEHIKSIIEKNVKYLILEMNYMDIEDTLRILKAYKKRY